MKTKTLLFALILSGLTACMQKEKATDPRISAQLHDLDETLQNYNHLIRGHNSSTIDGIKYQFERAGNRPEDKVFLDRARKILWLTNNLFYKFDKVRKELVKKIKKADINPENKLGRYASFLMLGPNQDGPAYAMKKEIFVYRKNILALDDSISAEKLGLDLPADFCEENFKNLTDDLVFLQLTKLQTEICKAERHAIEKQAAPLGAGIGRPFGH